MTTTTDRPVSNTRPPFVDCAAPGTSVGFERVSPVTRQATFRFGIVADPGTDGRPVLPGHVLVVSQGVTYQVHRADIRPRPASPFTAAQLDAMRAWVGAEGGDPAMSEAAIVECVARHYWGGIRAFLASLAA